MGQGQSSVFDLAAVAAASNGGNNDPLLPPARFIGRRGAQSADQIDTAARHAVRVAEPRVPRIRPHGTQARRVLTHPDARHTPVGAARAEQIEAVLLDDQL